MTTRLSFLLLLAAAGAGCLRSRADPPGRPPVAVELVPAEAADLVETVEVVGSLAPKLSAELKSEYSGIVTAVHVTDWVAVRKGQPLATLDTREGETLLAAATAAVMQAEVGETRAVREAERAEKLKQAGLMTEQGLADARTAREAARAGTAAARAQLEAARTRVAKAVIRAPFDGVVAFRGVSVGDRVESMGSGDPMFRIVDDRVLELTMSVPSGRLAELDFGQRVEFEVDGRPGRVFTGEVTRINPSVDPLSRAVMVMARVPNEDGALRGGLFAKARIALCTRRGVVQVPREALQGWDLESRTATVFVVEGDVARRRTVRTGSQGPEAVEVAEGIASGEQVATRGAFDLRDGDRVRTVPAPGQALAPSAAPAGASGR